MKLVQSFLLLATYHIYTFASTSAKVLDKKVKLPDVQLYSLVAEQLSELENLLGDKLSDRLVKLFKRYDVDDDAKYNSLLQTLSFIEEMNEKPANHPDGGKPKLDWGSRLKNTLKSAGKHLSKGNKYFKSALKTIVKISMREFFIYMLPHLEKINEHSIMTLRKEFRPAFARFIFNFYDLMFKRFHVHPPKNFSREHFEHKFHMDRDIHGVKELIAIEN